MHNDTVSKLCQVANAANAAAFIDAADDAKMEPVLRWCWALIDHPHVGGPCIHKVFQNVFPGKLLMLIAKC